MGIVTGLGVGICIGFLLRRGIARHLVAKSALKGSSEEMTSGDLTVAGECKLVLVVRNDLKMGKGKVAAQCSHASVLAYTQAQKKEPNLLKLWYLSGQRKVVVKIEDEKSLLKLRDESHRAGLLTSVIRDAGHTQVAPGSLTVMGVGPAPEELVDKVTGHLKLY